MCEQNSIFNLNYNLNYVTCLSRNIMHTNGGICLFLCIDGHIDTCPCKYHFTNTLAFTRAAASTLMSTSEIGSLREG